MKRNQNIWIIVFISCTIVLTISAQVYTNIRQYDTNRHLLYKQVHFCLDKAVDTYFANVAKGGILSLTSEDTEDPNKTITETLRVKDRFSESIKSKIDSTLQILSKTDTTKTYIISPIHGDKKSSKNIYNYKKRIPKHLDKLISKVYVSFTKDSLDLKKLDKYLARDLKRKGLNLNYALSYTHRRYGDDTVKISKLHFENFPKKHISVTSNSSYLPHKGGKLKIHYTDETTFLLRRSLRDIFFSLVLSLSIISCLLYLLYTINKQKKIAAIKNDFISNMSHEFKTPIATISAALEAIKNFNKTNNTAKTEKYIDMSAVQVQKLNEMVEKILDIATLHSDKLVIERKPTDLVQLLRNCTNKHQLISPDKVFLFKPNIEKLNYNVDTFHFEHAIDNLLDNAIKYGGTEITVSITAENNTISIRIQDNGIGIDKKHKHKIFDQFFRIQKGNIHDTKGFGIGLFYTKKIIEKHEATIEIETENTKLTSFKIDLKNE
ncbi:sensor histidine kinase [Flavicella sediminum]|uniref:sensor histidine kinase n=1 Tax=Flavicella sediminum TaxID=2585141 RepID=UPI001122BC51|nr:HAMP domain-containing sensor histidine kinase [Flavicella sediminum]